MQTKITSILFIFITLFTYSQELPLPWDLRQHNLTVVNPSLWNPAMGLQQQKEHRLSNWTRWQWQEVDGDPTTIFANYSYRFSQNDVAGAGYFQNNTPIFQHKGGVFNYAHRFVTDQDLSLSVGMNIFAFNRQSLQSPILTPDIDLPGLSQTDEFVVHLAPGIYFQAKNWGIGLASENLLEFVSGGDDKSEHDVSYFGSVDYTLPLTLFGTQENTYLQPRAYIKTLPGYDAQLGLVALLNTSKFWAQGGFNNYYGISGGAGIHLFETIAVGALIESGMDAPADSEDPSFELYAAIQLGKKHQKPSPELEEEVILNPEIKEEEKVVATEVETPKPETLEKTIEEETKPENAVVKTEPKNNPQLKLEQVRPQPKPKTQPKPQPKPTVVEKPVVETAVATTIQDLDKKPKNIHFEEAKIAGEKPGYYIIANVFGTQKYLKLFKEDMRKKGFDAQSFYRPARKLNYVYLEYHTSLEAAEKAVRSKLNGKYSQKLWIYRINP